MEAKGTRGLVDYRIEKAGGTCVKTGAEIVEGQAYYAVLFEDGESFRREAYCEDAWSGPPEGAYCHFKTRVPVKAKKQRLLVDDDMLVEFFRRLKDEKELVRLQFRFVLALILMRKRLLKYEETEAGGDAEYWLMRVGKEEEIHRVLNPRLADEEIERVSKELGAILHGDVKILDEEAETPAAETPAEETA